MTNYSHIAASVVFLIFCVAATAQRPEDILSTQLTGKNLIAKDYAADSERKYSYTNNSLTSEPPLLREFAITRMEKVIIEGTQVKLSGTRKFVVRDSISNALVSTSYTALTNLSVDFPAGTEAELSGKLRDLLFFTSLQEAQNSLPLELAKCLPQVFDQKRKDYAEKQTCTPPDFESTFTLNKTDTPPKIISQIKPFLPIHPPSAPRVLISVLVGIDGRPQDIWLIRTADTDYDLSVASMIMKSRFEPAKRNGLPLPIRVTLIQSTLVH